MRQQVSPFVAEPDGPAPPAGERAFDALYLGSLNRLVSQLYLVTGDLEEARDCVQEAFSRAWLRWDRLQREADDPVAWVHRVAYRIAVSRWRRAQAGRRALHRMAVPPDQPGPTPDAVTVATALARLPHGQRAVVVLHYYEGLLVTEIARLLDLTPSGDKTRLLRARRTLGLLLADERPAHPDEEAHRA